MLTISSVMGNSQKLDGGAMFGNVPKAMWEQWVQVDDQNRIDLFCRAMLIHDQESNKKILLETGIGAFFAPKYKERFGVVEDEHILLESLAKLGLQHSDIDVVILSHLHFDHVGGIVSKYQEDENLELLFPNAQFLASVDAWERATNPHVRDRASFIPEILNLLQASNRLELISGSTSKILGKNFSFRMSDGHTPGLMLTEVHTQDGPIVFAADLIPGVPWVHVPVTMGYDRYPELLINEKKELLEYLVENNGCIFFTHDTATALARVEKSPEGKFKAVDCLESLIQKVYNA